MFSQYFGNIDISLESLIIADCMYREIQILNDGVFIHFTTSSST